MCALVAGELGARPTRCSSARPASSATRSRWTPSGRGAGARGRPVERPGGRHRGGRGDPHHRHRAQGVRGPRPRLRRRRHGQGRGDARPEHGHDARRAHHRRGGRPRPPDRASLQAGVADSFNAMSSDGCTSTNDTVLLLASGRGRPARRPRRVRRRRRRGLPRPGHADGRRRRGPHQGGAGARHRGRLRRRGARRRPQGGREPAREVLVVRQGPVLGPGRQRARIARASPSSPTGSPSATATWWSPRAASRPRSTRRRWPRTWSRSGSRSSADLGLGDGTARILTNDLTHAYVDENMGTS